MHEEMNSISNMVSFRSSTNFVCTCFAGEICMNKILFKPNVVSHNKRASIFSTEDTHLLYYQVILTVCIFLRRQVAVP